MAKYIYQAKRWPQFTWDDRFISQPFGQVRHLQGQLLAIMKGPGFQRRDQAMLSSLATEMLSSSQIEGEMLNEQQVQSSIARQLGLDAGGLGTMPSRSVDGIVAMMLDATQIHLLPPSQERLFNWHGALFPTGRSGLYQLEVARYRSGEMQIVSGAMVKEKLHYKALPAASVEAEINAFLHWINDDEDDLDLVVKAALAHFRFIIIHPFDDGNGRIVRGITEWLLAKSEGSSHRFYSFSQRILQERKDYYAVLQRVQHCEGDVTPWLGWFFECLLRALQDALAKVSRVEQKTAFWYGHEQALFNSRQTMMINKLFDGFDGKLSTSKWARITKVSQDNSLRDIQALMALIVLVSDGKGGRSTGYVLAQDAG